MRITDARGTMANNGKGGMNIALEAAPLWRKLELPRTAEKQQRPAMALECPYLSAHRPGVTKSSAAALETLRSLTFAQQMSLSNAF